MKKVKFKLTPNKLAVINDALGVSISSDGTKSTTAVISIKDELATKFQKLAITHRDGVPNKPFKVSLKIYEACFFQAILLYAAVNITPGSFERMALDTIIAEIDPQIL